MRKMIVLLKGLFALSLVYSSPAEAMFKKPHFEGENKSYTRHAPVIQPLTFNHQHRISRRNISQAPHQRPGQVVVQREDSFNTLPTELQLQVIDYLPYHDQFRLAQTCREQLILWGSITHVHDPVISVTSTPDVTYLNANTPDQWPHSCFPTVMISVSRNMQEEEINMLFRLHLENIQHLHFVRQTDITEQVSVNIDDLLIGRRSLAPRLRQLRSLSFDGVLPEFYSPSSGIQTLETFQVSHVSLPSSYGLSSLVAHRPNLYHIRFSDVSLSSDLLQDIYQTCLTYRGRRAVEFINTPEGNLRSLHNSTDFRYRSWVTSGNDLHFHFRPSSREDESFLVSNSWNRAFIPLARYLNETPRLVALNRVLRSVYDSLVFSNLLMPFLRSFLTEDRLRILSEVFPSSILMGRLALWLPNSTILVLNMEE